MDRLGSDPERDLDSAYEDDQATYSHPRDERFCNAPQQPHDECLHELLQLSAVGHLTWWAQLRAPNLEVMVSDRHTGVISNKKEIKRSYRMRVDLIKTGEGLILTSTTVRHRRLDGLPTPHPPRATYKAASVVPFAGGVTEAAAVALLLEDAGTAGMMCRGGKPPIIARRGQ